MVHAEVNAIIHARRECFGFSLYTTLFPCNECAKIIVQSGIKQVFYSSDKHEGEKEVIAAKKILNDAGVKFNLISTPEVIIKKV